VLLVLNGDSAGSISGLKKNAPATADRQETIQQEKTEAAPKRRLWDWFAACAGIEMGW
jgi:hypothetical protein